MKLIKKINIMYNIINIMIKTKIKMKKIKMIENINKYHINNTKITLLCFVSEVYCVIQFFFHQLIK